MEKENMSEIIFKIPHYEEVAYWVFSLIKELKENYRKNIYIDLPKELILDIINKDFSEVREEIIKNIKEKHNIPRLEEVKKEIEGIWKPLNDLFFNNLKKITGFDFEYKEYIVYITKIIRGCYSSTNQVFINPMKNMTLYVTAEEIFHLHYWNIFRKVIKDVEIPWKINKKIWEISEVVPEFVLTDDSFKKFGWGKNLKRNYPFIKEIKKRLDPLWENKKDFKDFLIKAHQGIF